MLPDAIETAITSADRVHVANLIEQFMERQRASQPAQYMQNPQEFHTLRRWLDALPIELIQQRPLLCLGQATTLLLVAILEQRPFAPSDIARMEEGFQLAQQGFRAQGDMLGLASALILHATIERHFGHITEAANAVRQALEYLPDQDVMWRSSGLGILGIEELFTGQVEKALQTALAAHAFCEQLNYPAIMRANTVLLSRVYYEHGELHLAARHSREMLVSARQEQDYDDIGDAQLGLAQISYEWNDLAAAQQQATEALEMGQRLANEEVQVEATLVLVRIKQAQGKSVEAQQRCLALLAQQSASPQGVPLRARLNWQIQMTLLRLQLASEDITAVERWARSHVQQAGAWLPESEREDLLSARLLLAQKRNEEAREITERVAEAAQRAGRTRIALEAHLLTSLAYASTHLMQEARQQAQMLVAQTTSEGYLRLFLDEGEAMATLLQALVPTTRGEVQGAYLRRILLAFAHRQGEGMAPGPATLIEPLSAQEQRVLRLLAGGHTNPEIASALVVSVNTVKTQVQSIFRKLNVKNRVEASKIAHQLHLL